MFTLKQLVETGFSGLSNALMRSIPRTLPRKMKNTWQSLCFKTALKALSVATFFMLAIPHSVSTVYAEESAQINLRDVEIPTLVETVSRITGKSFVVDPRVKGRVTVITSQDISDDELYETFLSILQVHGFSAVPSGANLIKIVPSNQAKQQPVPVVNDEGRKENRMKSAKQNKPKADELITRVVRVEHVPAAMLVPILRPLVPSTGQLQAYGPSNTIVISDRAANIDRLIKVIKRMDRADDEEIEVVPLKFASAKTLAQTIQTLQKSNIKGVQGKNKVAADERTNSLLLSGDKSARQQVKKIIRKLDTAHKSQDKTQVVYLRYAKAEDLAKVLTGVSETKKNTKATGKGAAGTQKAEVDIQADESTNSLIITAEPDIQNNLAKVIKRLDVRRAQVLVEAVIAEVDIDLSNKLGVSLAINSDDGILGAAGTVAGIGTLLGILNDNTVPSSVPAGGTLALADSQGSSKFGLLVEALYGDGATNILSTPTLVAMDNEEASIVIGQNVPFVTGSFSSTSTGTTSNPSNPFQTIERQDVGITLKIKPQINAGDSINLEIEQEVSSLAASNASASDLITNKRSIATNVMVEDGQVLILGGLMEDTFRDQVNKVPGLGDIPVVGQLFRNSTTTKVKQNLMVFIHPVIMRDVLTADSYTQQKYNKLKYAQDKSRVDTRGILKQKATVFPENLRSGFINKQTPQSLKQQQRKQAQINSQPQAKMAQQRNAAQKSRFRMQQAASNKAVSRKTPVRPKVVPKSRNKKERASQQVDDFLNGIN